MDRRRAIKNISGALLIGSSLTAILESCKTESRLSWKPLYFSDDEALTIGSLADTILPRTDTPGALDVNVDIFIDKVVYGTYDDAGQKNLSSEIQLFNDYCKKNYRGKFADLIEKDRHAVLSYYEKMDGKFNPRVWGTAVGDPEKIGFYRSMKSMILWAYTSSEAIGKNVLNYDPVPGVFKGCIEVEEVGNRWTF